MYIRVGKCMKFINNEFNLFIIDYSSQNKLRDQFLNREKRQK